jgi:predicted enzyme related to lactoylglutathione lyase
MRAQPMIAVRDVEKASDWYQQLLGVTSDMEAGHPHRKEYDRILSGGEVILQLHSWDTPDAGELDRVMTGPDAAPHGHGVLLNFRVDDFDSTVERARTMGIEIIEDVHTQPDLSRAFAFRDPDGYVVLLTSAAQS